MKKSKRITFFLIICLTFLGVTLSFSDENADEIENVYKTLLDVRRAIFARVYEPDLTADELRENLDEFSKKVEPLVKTDSGKAFAAIAKNDLADIVAMESQCNGRIKPEENESHVLFIRRTERYVNQIYDDSRKNLDDVFTSANIPDNSYLTILYHHRSITLECNKGLSASSKPPADVREHCDALMNGPLFDRNATILQPPVSIDFIWKSNDASQIQRNVVHAIQKYLLNCQLYKLAKKNEGMGIRWTTEELHQEFANEQKYLLDAYPLSKYPLLGEFIESHE